VRALPSAADADWAALRADVVRAVEKRRARTTSTKQQQGGSHA